MDKTNLLEALNIEQRRKRAQTARRREPQLQRARQIAAKRMANDDALMRRARKMAKDAVRKRFAGERGANYANLSPSEKYLIDKIVDGKEKLITRLAQKLLPRVRTAERERLKNARNAGAKATAANKSMIRPRVPLAEQVLEEEIYETIENAAEEIKAAAETMQLTESFIEDILSFEGVTESDAVASVLTRLCPVDLDDRFNQIISESATSCTRVAMFDPATGNYRIEEIDNQTGPIQEHPTIRFLMKGGWQIVSINLPEGPRPVQVAVTNRQRQRRTGES